jgi:hypothetical protein
VEGISYALGIIFVLGAKVVKAYERVDGAA